MVPMLDANGGYEHPQFVPKYANVFPKPQKEAVNDCKHDPHESSESAGY